MEERSLRPVSAVEAARQLISLALGLLMQAMFDPQAEDWGDVFRRTFELHLDGLLRRDT
jgi:flagellar biosynthesis protein FliR